MQKKLLITLVICALLGAAGLFFLKAPKPNASNLNFVFRSEDGSFTVRFPGRPQQMQKEEVLGRGLMYQDDDEQCAYTVVWLDPGDTSRLDEVYEKVRESTLRLGGKVTTERAIQLHGKYRGTAWEVVNPPGAFGVSGKFRARAYIVGLRIYAMWVFSHTGWNKWYLADEFLDSFQLTKK